MKKIFYKIELKIKNRYSGNGIVRIFNDTFIGYLSNDLILGCYTEHIFYILIMQRDIIAGNLRIMKFAKIMQDFELPNIFSMKTFNAKEQSIYELCINFKEKCVISNEAFTSRINELKEFMHF